MMLFCLCGGVFDKAFPIRCLSREKNVFSDVGRIFERRVHCRILFCGYGCSKLFQTMASL